MGAQAVRLSNVDIDNALKDKDFEVLFQPIFDLGNGALARVETFIRWRHSSLGMLPPGAFISFFETQGRMSELTRYVLAEALGAYEDWRGAHAPGFSINLALSDLSDETFPSHLTVVLRERGFPTELVTLECPMPPVGADVESMARQLQRLAETGVRLAIEVRGRANDFLKTVRPFPFAEIKTGGAAILRFARTVRGPGLSAISELLELAAEQNAAITAVGVEDQASLSALRGLGFAAAQGNHLGKVGALSQFMPSHVNDVRALLGLEPLSSEDLAALFRTGGPRLAAAAVEPEPADAGRRDADAAAPETPAPVSRADDLIERLAARIARADAAKTGADADETTPAARAKAAAIARARRNSLIREKAASRNALKAKAEAQGERPPPRELQERLSREFESGSGDAPATDEFEIAGEEFEPTMPDPVDESAPPSDAAEIPSPAEEIAAPAQISAAAPTVSNINRAARMAVAGATAHFTPTIRVSGPGATAAPPKDLGDLHREESAAPSPAGRPAAAPAAADDGGDEIPASMSSAEWLEETVAFIEPEPAAPKANFLTRKYRLRLPQYSGYFWPRPIRRMWKRSRRRQ